MFLPFTLHGSEWSVSHPGCFIPRETAPNTNCTRGWVGAIAGLPFAGVEPQSLGHPARSLLTVSTALS